MNAIPAKKVKRRGIAAEQEAYYARVRVSLDEVKVGKVEKFKSAADLLKELEAYKPST